MSVPARECELHKTLVHLPLQSHDPPESCRCQGHCRGSRSRSWRSQTSTAELYLWIHTHTHTKEGILIINYSNGCLTVNDFQFPVNCGKVFNFKYTEEASNLYEQKTATTVNLHSKEENFLKLFIYK